LFTLAAVENPLRPPDRQILAGLGFRAIGDDRRPVRLEAGVDTLPAERRFELGERRQQMQHKLTHGRILSSVDVLRRRQKAEVEIGQDFDVLHRVPTHPPRESAQLLKLEIATLILGGHPRIDHRLHRFFIPPGGAFPEAPGGSPVSSAARARRRARPSFCFALLSKLPLPCKPPREAGQDMVFGLF
jgi:hypothetical protein